MSLIEKIDERIKYYREFYADRYQAKAEGLEIAKEIILSEQKEPCEYCKVYSELPLPLTSKRLSIKVKHCPNCGKPINQPYKEQ